MASDKQYVCACCSAIQTEYEDCRNCMADRSFLEERR